MCVSGFYGDFSLILTFGAREVITMYYNVSLVYSYSKHPTPRYYGTQVMPTCIVNVYLERRTEVAARGNKIPCVCVL